MKIELNDTRSEISNETVFSAIKTLFDPEHESDLFISFGKFKSISFAFHRIHFLYFFWFYPLEIPVGCDAVCITRFGA